MSSSITRNSSSSYRRFVSSPDVIVKVAGLSKLLLALLAFKRSFVRVNSEMLRQVARLHECLVAHGASVRSMLQVEPNVLS